MIPVVVVLAVAVAVWLVLGRWHERVAAEQAIEARRLAHRSEHVNLRERRVMQRERDVDRQERAVAAAYARAVRVRRRSDPAGELERLVPAETTGPVWSEMEPGSDEPPGPGHVTAAK